MELYRMTALELGTVLRKGELSPADALAAARERKIGRAHV